MKTKIIILLFASIAYISSQTFNTNFYINGSKLCNEPMQGITVFRNSQNYKLDGTNISMDTLNGTTIIEYILTSKEGGDPIANDTIFNLNRYLSVKKFSANMKSNYWTFDFYYKIDGVPSKAYYISLNVFDRCFETDVNCQFINVTEKYLTRQCQARESKIGYISRSKDSLSFVFVDTTFKSNLQFYCITDTTKPIFQYQEIKLTENKDLASYQSISIRNKVIEATQNGFVTIKETVLSNSIVKKIVLDRSNCLIEGVNDVLVPESEVYPTPATEVLHIKSSPDAVVMTDVYGKSTTIKGNGAYNTEGLAKGLYILSYLSGNVKKSQRVEIQ